MINILEILKQIPNLEDYIFYSPLQGDVKVNLCSDYECPIELYAPNSNYQKAEYLVDLTANGYYDNISFGEREIMLYPSRQQRDWSKFEIPKKDLPENTPVMYCTDPRIGWFVGKYGGNSTVKTTPINCKYEYVVPIDKFNFEDWTFKEQDNYGNKK